MTLSSLIDGVLLVKLRTLLLTMVYKSVFFARQATFEQSRSVPLTEMQVASLKVVWEIYTREGISNVTFEELRINEYDLDTQRMLDLMAVSDNGPKQPLYLQYVFKIP